MRAALQEIMRHVHPFSRPWFSYLPPQDVHCNEFPTTADFWYDVHTRKTTTDHDPRRRTDQCNLHMHVNSNENKSPLKNTRSPFPTHVSDARAWLSRGGRVRAGPRGARARETDSAVFSMSNLIKKNVHPIPSTGMAPSQPPGTGRREPHSLHTREPRCYQVPTKNPTRTPQRVQPRARNVKRGREWGGSGVRALLTRA